jgi:hypothetical protein
VKVEIGGGSVNPNRYPAEQDEDWDDIFAVKALLDSVLRHELLIKAIM